VHGEFDPVAAMESLQKGDISWLTEDFMIKRYIQRIDLFPKAWGIDPDNVAPYFTAPHNAIVAAIDHILKTYGSTADYLKAKAGIPKNRLNDLKQQLLE